MPGIFLHLSVAAAVRERWRRLLPETFQAIVVRALPELSLIHI